MGRQKNILEEEKKQYHTYFSNDEKRAYVVRKGVVEGMKPQDVVEYLENLQIVPQKVTKMKSYWTKKS